MYVASLLHHQRMAQSWKAKSDGSKYCCYVQILLNATIRCITLLHRSRCKMGSTTIINNTCKNLNLKVGNNHHFVHLTTIESHRSYSFDVACNATYQEYFVGEDDSTAAEGRKQLIISSDDCCDNKCFTITDSTDGAFNVDKEPRLRISKSGADLNLQQDEPDHAICETSVLDALWRWLKKLIGS